MKLKYTNHSGGCPGADMTWEIVGREYGEFEEKFIV